MTSCQLPQLASELAIVGAAPELAADGGRVAQVFDGFEERHRHQAGIEAGTFACTLHRDAAQPRQPDHGEHIFHRGCAADDVLANGLGRAAVLDFGDDAEGFEHARRLRREAAGQRRRDGVGDRFLQGRGVNARVLADVERVQMQAEGAHLQDQRIDQRARDAHAAIRSQRGAQRLQIVDEILHRAVGRQRLRQLVLAARQRVGHHGQSDARSSMRFARFLQRALDARLEADDEAAVVLELVLRAEDLRLGRVHLRDVGAQALQQRVAHRPLLRAGGEQVDDLVELALVVEQQMAAGQLQRIARDFGRDEGIAVAVAADPRAEAQHLGQLERIDLELVGRAKGRGDFAIELGQRVEDGDVVVVEAHLDFVVNGGPARAHLVGLPEAGDLGENKFLEARHVLFGNGNAVERLEKLADAAALEHHGAARDLSGMRGEDRHDEHAAQPVQSLFRADAHAAHLAERAFERAALAAGLAAQAQSDAAALAVVGFGQIDELEVEGEGAGEQDGALDGQRVHQFKRGGGVARGFFGAAASFGVAAADGALAQRFDLRKHLVAGLLAQHLAEQRAQRAHVAAQRRLFQVAGLRFQFGQPLRPALGIPQKSHRILIMHEENEGNVTENRAVA